MLEGMFGFEVALKRFGLSYFAMPIPERGASPVLIPHSLAAKPLVPGPFCADGGA